MRRLKVGVIGLGEVSQVIHLPVLECLSDKFEIAAICDISVELLQVLGDRYRVGAANRFTNFEELTALPELDAVFVLNSNEYHRDCVVAAAKNGKHVLVEKPMCLTLREADEIIEARDEAGVQVMVGYMRRFAPAFLQAVEEVGKLERIHYARIRDLIGPNSYFVNQSSNVIRPQDMPEEAMQDRKIRNSSLMVEALGDVSNDLRSAYGVLCGLGSHDLSAMRELLGFPKRVIAATQWNGGRYLNAIFEFDGYHASYETGVDKIGRFDAHLEVTGTHKSLMVQYNTPYIRHLPTTLTIKETIGDAFTETVIRPSFKDPYTYELEFFYDRVIDGLSPKTTPEDYKEDLKLFQMLIEAMKVSQA